MKLLIEKASCKINETLSGSVWEIDTDQSVLFVDEGKEYLLLPSNSLVDAETVVESKEPYIHKLN